MIYALSLLSLRDQIDLAGKIMERGEGSRLFNVKVGPGPALAALVALVFLLQTYRLKMVGNNEKSILERKHEFQYSAAVKWL